MFQERNADIKGVIKADSWCENCHGEAENKKNKRHLDMKRRRMMQLSGEARCLLQKSTS